MILLVPVLVSRSDFNLTDGCRFYRKQDRCVASGAWYASCNLETIVCGGSGVEFHGCRDFLGLWFYSYARFHRGFDGRRASGSCSSWLTMGLTGWLSPNWALNLLPLVTMLFWLWRQCVFCINPSYFILLSRGEIVAAAVALEGWFSQVRGKDVDGSVVHLAPGSREDGWRWRASV